MCIRDRPKPIRESEENWDDDRNDRPENSNINALPSCRDTICRYCYKKLSLTARKNSSINALSNCRDTICRFCYKNLSAAARNDDIKWDDWSEESWRRNADSTTDSTEGLVPINSGYIPKDGENWDDVVTSSTLAAVQSDLKNKCVILPIPPSVTRPERRAFRLQQFKRYQDLAERQDGDT